VNHGSCDRRTFVRRAVGLAAVLAAPTRARAAPPGVTHHCASATRDRQPSPHPDPRPGVDASRVVPRDQLPDDTEVRAAFDMVRQIPQIVDGIRCHCGCATLPGYRSLLSCFEGDGMARHCQVCQAQARLAFELHKRGRALDAIRSALDRRFG
jgi:hypothetical protein